MATGRAVDFSSLLQATCSEFAGRGWILDRAKAFVSQSDGVRSMVVLGDPGAGKTALLARIASDTGAAHFFCGRSDGIGAERGGGWSEPIRCAETLGTQLVRTYGPEIVDWSRFGLDVRVRAERVYGQLTGAELKSLQTGPRPYGRPLVEVDIDVGTVGRGGFVTGLSIQELRIDPMLALQELFLGPLRRAALKATGNVIVVLDGLDEWDRLASPVDVLDILQRSALPTNIKIIASARSSYAPRLAPETVTIDISDVGVQAQFDDDVAQLVDVVLSKKGLVLQPNDRRDLISRAGGNFLFASYLLQTIDVEAPAKSLEGQPPGLDAFYRQELDKLVDQFAREGVRESLGPLLAVVCSAREPLGAWTAAQACDMLDDAATDALDRMRAFIRPCEVLGELRYAPFHLSFSEFVLSGRAGIGIAPQTGHRRLAERLAPKEGAAKTWNNVSDYAIRHIVAHAAAAGVDAMSLTRSLVETPAYLVARVERLGAEALDEDLRYARQVGFDPPHLGAIVVELALRAQTHRAARISAAQGLAAIASAVGAPEAAVAFANLSPEPVFALPLWAAGREGARIAVGAIRCEGMIKAAALTAGTLLTLTRTDHVLEVWNLRERLRLASLEAIPGLDMAEVEPDGRRVWAASWQASGQSRLRRLSLPDGAVIQVIEFLQRITALRTSTDGKHVAVGTEEGRVYLIDVETCRIAERREAGSGMIRCLRFDKACLAALTGHRKVVCWSLPGLALEGVVALPCKAGRFGFKDRTHGLALDAARRQAIVAGEDGVVTEIDFIDEEIAPRPLASLPGWADHVALLAEADIIAGDSTGRLHFIARDARRPMISIQVHASGIVLVDAYVTSDLTVTVAENGEIGLWSNPTDSRVGEAAHGARVTDLRYSGSGTRIMSFGTDGSLVEWTADGRIRQRAYLNPEAFNDVRVADLNTILIQKDGVQRQTLAEAPETLVSVVAWPMIISDKCSTLFAVGRGPISITGDASLAATGGDDGLEIWSLDPPQLRLRYPKEKPAGRGAISDDGQLLVSEGEDGTLWLRSLDEETPPRVIPLGGSLLCAPFSTSDGVRLLTQSERNIHCISSDLLEVETSWMMTSDTPNFAVATPDGNTLVVFGYWGQIEFRRRRDGQRLGGFLLRPPASVAAFSPDGRTLAIGDMGGGVQACRLQSIGEDRNGT